MRVTILQEPFLSSFLMQFVHIGGPNPGVDFHFMSPQKSTVSRYQVKWKVEDWGDCSEDCAGGTVIK